MDEKNQKAIRQKARAALVGKIEREQIAPMLLAMCELLDHLMDDDPHALDSWHPTGKKMSAAALTIEDYLDLRGADNEDPHWIRQMRDTVARYKRERVKKAAPVPLETTDMSPSEVREADASAFEM
jgi:hypothetical protein